MKKQAYVKPALRKVRLEVKTSVLGVCHTSTVSSPLIPGGLPCKINSSCSS